MSEICNNCISQERRFDGVLICQHRQSMRGLEAEASYILCDDVDGCRYHRPTTASCSTCDVKNCDEAQRTVKCPKIRQV